MNLKTFYERGHGFPCIAGSVDGSQVEVIGPSKPANEAVFVNRGNWHSQLFKTALLALSWR
jgi:hypothetical protein